MRRTQSKQRVVDKYLNKSKSVMENDSEAYTFSNTCSNKNTMQLTSSEQ